MPQNTNVVNVTEDGFVQFMGGKVRITPDGDIDFSNLASGLIFTDTNGSGNVYRVRVTDGVLTLEQQ